jgi:hypothetical protein
MIYLINIKYIIIKLTLLNIVINKNWLRKILKIKFNQFNNKLKILNLNNNQNKLKKENN